MNLLGLNNPEHVLSSANGANTGQLVCYIPKQNNRAAGRAPKRQYSQPPIYQIDDTDFYDAALFGSSNRVVQQWIQRPNDPKYGNGSPLVQI
jgi:hypothetical protein